MFEISYLILVICLQEICLVESNGKIPKEKGRNLHEFDKRDEGEGVGSGDKGIGNQV